MYQTILILHNALRWVFLLLAVFTILKALMGVINHTPFGSSDNKAAKFFIIVCHTQLLIGLLLLIISPTIHLHLEQGMRVIMKDKLTRLQIIEHPLTMIIGVALIQIGKIKTRKAYEDVLKHKRSLIYYSLGLILILSRIPWGNTPLFRGME